MASTALISNDYTILHDNVQPKPEINPYSVVDHRQRHLHGGAKSSLMQFMHQTSQVNALQKSGT